MRALGTRGMVASPHYLATEAGVSILRRGGTAIDAAIATNAVLGVVMPYACGIGGDLFALVYASAGKQLTGLNGSGRAPAEATLERVRTAAGQDTMPARGPLPVNVPGCVEAWGALHDRFGHLPFGDLLQPAIGYAREGFPVSKMFSLSIERSAPLFHPDTPAANTFLPSGSAPHEGQILRQPRLARTLEAIADGGPETYYRGWIAEEIVRSHRAVGGLLSEQDLAVHHSDWVEPLSATYHGLTVYELPPNSQGIIALMMLKILEHVPAEALRSGGDAYVHYVAEAARLAYADRDAHLTDPDHMTIDPSELLDDAYIRARARSIGERASTHVPVGSPGGTIYLCAADGDGNLVSLIESNYMGIGSGVMAGETGIMLQNRGAWFSLDADHPNVIAPGKRTMHTLMPAMAFREERPWLVFGTMGGSMQPQIHVEVLTRRVEQSLPLDDAIAAPRFDAVPGPDVDGGADLILEGRFPQDVVSGLRSRGHGVQVIEPFTSQMGHSHAIEILPDGVYMGAADPRADSLALGY